VAVYGGKGNSSRVYQHRFLTQASKVVRPGERVLDAGAGRAPYRRLFEHAQYETADFMAMSTMKYRQPDYVCDLSAIPVEDGRFDHVLLTQVLEHLPEPGRVLAELHRVLAPGGRLWLTAPLFYAEHQAPYDFYRYTQYGMRHVLETAGFEVVSLEWMEGYLGTLSYQVRVMSKVLPTRPRDYGGGPRGTAVALGARTAKRLGGPAADLLARLDVRFKFVDRGMPKNYQVVARKSTAA
jgi:SAM-dependent methyltransferase